ncbi:MAG: hypothetical protein E7525_02535 [Ruminococcaceae bacterium]|nr:hypothetical protein [Oscillospiraceae bacterium]
MTAVKFKRFLYLAVFCALTFAFWLLQSTGLLTFKIVNAVPQFMLIFTLLAGFYFKAYHGALFGFVFGALTDVYSSTLVFNTIALSVLGFTAGMLVTHLFNRNLAAVIVINSGGAAVYFLAKWLMFYAFSDPAGGYVLMNYMLTSAVLTSLFGFAVYFALNPFYKKMPVPDRSEQYDNY